MDSLLVIYIVLYILIYSAPEVTLNPSGHRPTPFEVWKSKQSHDGQEKKVNHSIIFICLNI